MKESTKAWLEFASRDLEAAKKLIDDDYLANIVLFHSQQCVEKCLKAILEESDQNVPRIHGVNRLYSLNCISYTSEFFIQTIFFTPCIVFISNLSRKLFTRSFAI